MVTPEMMRKIAFFESLAGRNIHDVYQADNGKHVIVYDGPELSRKDSKALQKRGIIPIQSQPKRERVPI
jgi:hypothetical protein